MGFSKSNNRCVGFLPNALNSYLWFTIIWVFAAIMLRYVEWVLIAGNHIVGSLLVSELKGLVYDVCFVSMCAVIFVLPYLLLKKLSSIFADILTILIATLFLTIHFCFVVYFQYELRPVDIFIFGYSFNELLFTINTSGIKIWYAFLVALFFVLVVGFLYFKFKKFYFPVYIRNFLYIVFISCALLNVSSLWFLKNYFYNEDSYLSVNKSQFFYNKCLNYIFSDKEVNNDELTVKLGKLFPDKRFVSADYPLLAETDFNNVLSAFFDIREEKPNIVIILSEGLASKFIGNYNGMVPMPFLTGLADKSLYWDNFLSAGERSHVAAPAILSSTPYGDSGFAKEEGCPFHFSFINLLERHGYYSTFYYGQGAWFDNKDAFLKRNGIDKIVDKECYGVGYDKVVSDGFFWGYRDKDLFSRSLSEINKSDICPRLDIYFTGSMHPPFDIADNDYYNRRLDSISNRFSTKGKEFVNKYREYLLSLLYTDDAYRDFFKKYAEREDFKNTIFIITGDHPMTELPMASTLERFHVPLFIYSPMLKKSCKFHSVNSHFDILPTFVAFFDQTCGMDMPEYNGFLGKVLDTAVNMRCLHPVNFMNPNRECVDMFYKNFFVANNNSLYSVGKDFSVKKIDNKALLDEISSLLPVFYNVNIDVCKNNKIITDSLFFQYTDPILLKNLNDSDSIVVGKDNQYYNLIDGVVIGQGVYYFLDFSGYTDFKEKQNKESGCFLVVDICDINGKNIFWRSFPISDKISIRWNFEMNSGNNIFKVYIWNKDSMQVTIYKPVLKLYTPMNNKAYMNKNIICN